MAYPMARGKKRQESQQAWHRLRRRGRDLRRPDARNVDRRRDYGEERIAAIGIAGGIELFVVYTMRGRNRHLISARRANKREREKYRQALGRNSSKGKTDWCRVARLSEEEIIAGAKSDPNAQPTVEEFWNDARLVMPEPKVPVTIRLDRDVVDWFKSGGSRYQTRMNAVLKAYMCAHKKAG
jgi:uncharacterized protein (DUF4415 family)